MKKLSIAGLLLLIALPTLAYKGESDDSLAGWNGEISKCSDKNLKACLLKVGPADYSEIKVWYPIVQLGAGGVWTSQVGQNNSFPIQNPNTDQFYYYTADKPSQQGGFFEMFLGSEWIFRPHWALQFGADYDQVYTTYRANGTYIQGADLQSSDTFSYHYNAITRQLLGEAKLLYTYRDTCHPYILGGIGVAFNTAYDFTTNVPPSLTFTRQYNQNTNTAFTWALGLGVDFDIYRDIRLGGGYRFTDLGKIELGQASIGNTPVSGSLSQSETLSNMLLVQLTFMF